MVRYGTKSESKLKHTHRTPTSDVICIYTARLKAKNFGLLMMPKSLSLYELLAGKRLFDHRIGAGTGSTVIHRHLHDTKAENPYKLGCDAIFDCKLGQFLAQGILSAVLGCECRQCMDKQRHN
jgi:hypothetical protein